MLLGYSVSFSILLLLERVRTRMRWLDEYYLLFMDEKDRNDTTTNITHLALLAGCAGPLWISKYVSTFPPLLPYAGLIVLGVGDSMGAIVGTTHGRIKWPQSKRTLEGSGAMFISMLLLTLPFDGCAWWWCLHLTFLEACTSQLDNLCLPLVGSSLLLSLRR
mmetsp:Transcript_27328/g.41986  ORF Transcript_27328/g.41986 Transcript_27328/m.41986 type:complete len:162 (+) Transcript_27328:135-620(+)